MLKTCPICGKEFDAARCTRKYCGERCRKTAKHAAQNKSRAEARAAENRPCAVCGRQIPPEFRRGRIYCSEECQCEGRRRKHRQWNATPQGQDSKKRTNARVRGSAKPPTPKATDVYIPDDAARARAAITNEFRRQTRARSY